MINRALLCWGADPGRLGRGHAHDGEYDPNRADPKQEHPTLTTLEAEVRRPAGSMNYRDWPRLIEQLRTVARQIQGPQARPTEGQIAGIDRGQTAAAQRAQELSVIVDGVIADLNRLLQDAPKILTDWRRVVM